MTKLFKILSLLILILNLTSVFSQIVSITDSNFKNYLLSNASINTNNDSEIQISEANSFSGIINLYNIGVSDLAGIEEFTNLKVLNCSSNQLSTIDISANVNLQSLYCNHNNLTFLDVSNNINLNHIQCNNNSISNIVFPTNSEIRTLFCSKNQLSDLDLSQSLLLSDINCANNQIDSLNLNNHPRLQTVICNNNILEFLNIKNSNTNNILTFDSTNNTPLTCIEVDNTIWASSHLIKKDIWANYSTSCP